MRILKLILNLHWAAGILFLSVPNKKVNVDRDTLPFTRHADNCRGKSTQSKIKKYPSP